jgi:hypothetical protein
VKCEAHRHVLQPCLGGCAVWGTKELEKFDLLEFTVNATSNGRCMRRTSTGFGALASSLSKWLIKCLRHVLKGSHHPDYITHCYLLLPENLLISLGVRPLRCGCYWRRRASSPSTLSSASMVPSNHDYLHAHNQLN